MAEPLSGVSEEWNTSHVVEVIKNATHDPQEKGNQKVALKQRFKYHKDIMPFIKLLLLSFT